MKQFVLDHRSLLIACGLALAIVLSLCCAFPLRFDFFPPRSEARNLLFGLAIALPVKAAVYYATRLHRGWWSTAGVRDVVRIGYSTLLASVNFALAAHAVIGPSFPRSIYVIDFVLSFVGIAGARLGIRLYRESGRNGSGDGKHKRVLIYGAGWAGTTLLREIRGNPRLDYAAVGFLDDSPKKRGELVGGLPVLGAGPDAKRLVGVWKRRGRPIQEILIAMPTATAAEMRAAIACCRESGAPCKTLPGIGELLDYSGLAWQIREVAVEDLLCREPVELDQASIRDSIAGYSVMVTGAGGSIGSELCRQVAALNPRKLVALDQAESEMFRIDLELRNKFPALELVTVIGDIRDAKCVEEALCANGVDSVFHAAAYKHVPLMEAHAVEAARNNILGTWNLALAAVRNGVRRFVLISSDKAVNPASVMGATKRAAEQIVASLAGTGANGAPKFVSVRFGNVLASNGSVVPLFRSQIAAGGPVTVTHPEMRRYFMTIREAVQLVLQASSMAQGREIFVLDMGQPVKIVDLARTMIQLSGLVPDQDVHIRFTGIRPGEKLYEELTTDGIKTAPTGHPKVKVLRHPAVDSGLIQSWITELAEIVDQRDGAGVIEHLHRLIPEYQGGGCRPQEDTHSRVAVVGAAFTGGR